MSSSAEGAAASAAPPFKRPESVLIVIHTAADDFLLLRRARPSGYWQSVTGSLEWGETADGAARRELLEETGIAQGLLLNLQWTQTYEIDPAFGKRFAPGVGRNLEHAFALRLTDRVPVIISPREHLEFRWVAGREAVAVVSSSSNRIIIEQLRR